MSFFLAHPVHVHSKISRTSIFFGNACSCTSLTSKFVMIVIMPFLHIFCEALADVQLKYYSLTIDFLPKLPYLDSILLKML